MESFSPVEKGSLPTFNGNTEGSSYYRESRAKNADCEYLSTTALGSRTTLMVDQMKTETNEQCSVNQ
uniref:Uncharacterized protein n=1 Tax=Anguilla anguilla TaxID=7936 RepID=A0A0E9PZM2_ANGAN